MAFAILQTVNDLTYDTNRVIKIIIIIIHHTSLMIFQPIALETLGPMNSSAVEFFTVLGRKIGVSSGDDREGRFLFQRLSMTLQRYNAILLDESFEGVDDRTSSSSRFFVLISSLFNPRYLTIPRVQKIKKIIIKIIIIIIIIIIICGM